MSLLAHVSQPIQESRLLMQRHLLEGRPESEFLPELLLVEFQEFDKPGADFGGEILNIPMEKEGSVGRLGFRGIRIGRLAA